MNRRFALERMLNDDPQITDNPTFGGGGTSPGAVLKNRLQGLVRQRGQVQRRSQFLNTSPLGETSPQDAQSMVDLSQSIAALGQKVANPKKGVQFAPEPRVSTMQNATQAGWNMDRARSAVAGTRAAGAAAADLEMGNVENELSMLGAGNHAALARQYSRRR